MGCRQNCTYTNAHSCACILMLTHTHTHLQTITHKNTFPYEPVLIGCSDKVQLFVIAVPHYSSAFAVHWTNGFIVTLLWSVEAVAAASLHQMKNGYMYLDHKLFHFTGNWIRKLGKEILIISEGTNLKIICMYVGDKVSVNISYTAITRDNIICDIL